MAASSSTIRQLWEQVYGGLNWFRIHLLAYTIIPFIFSGFFMAANPSFSSGHFVTAYIDALFMCFSAMTVTGLNVVSVSQLRPAQQAFLFILMIIGDISIVNLLTIFARQTWLRLKCRQMVDGDKLQRLYRRGEGSSGNDAENGERETGISGDPGSRDGDGNDDQGMNGNGNGKANGNGQANGNGHQEEGDEHEKTDGREGGGHGSSTKDKQAGKGEEKKGDEHNAHGEGLRRRHELRQKSGHATPPRSPYPNDPHGSIPHASSGLKQHSGRGGFASFPQIIFPIADRILPGGISRLTDILHRYEEDGLHSSHPMRSFGKMLEKPFDDHRDASEKREAKSAKWLPPGVRSVVVGRNSQFFEEELNDEDLELLGTLEYRATRILTFLLIAHQLFWIFVPVTIIAIYFAKTHTWDAVFTANGATQSGEVNKTWYSFFQVVSAYSSCGLSLSDTLMIPFQANYLLIWVLICPMLAGNQALPLFLRLEVWLLTKVVRKGGELDVSLHFILTHGRRLFLYLFPAYHSWYLLAVEGVITIVGTVGFIVLNHGLPYYSTLGSGWDRFSIGLFHSLTARASGLGIVYINQMAPALNFLYLMIIFTSNYPLVMAIRSTNVYEERALGLHGEHAPRQQNQKGASGEIFSKYLKQHLLPQIFFDLWPVSTAVVFICIMERGKLMDSDNVSWLGVFQIIFEATSAYGTIGLTFGNVYNTSSLSASFRKISKLIIILLMLRGRHRGLPLAIDRATMFPIEYRRGTGEEREKVEEDRVGQAGEEAEQE